MKMIEFLRGIGNCSILYNREMVELGITYGFFVLFFSVIVIDLFG